MSDKKFTVRDIAELVEGELKGNPDLVIDGVSSLKDAGPSQVSFLGNRKYANQLPDSKAGLVLISRDMADDDFGGRSVIVCGNVDLAFSKAIMLFAPPAVEYPRSVHSSAVVAPSAKIGKDVHIGAHAVIEQDAEIGDGVTVCAGCYIGHGSVIGALTTLYPHVTVMARCRIGAKCIIHPGVVIGADGFGFMPTRDGIIKIPQVGIVEIHDDVEIGANTTIDRARFGKTIIKSNVKIDNQVMVAHNVVVNESSILIAQSGIAGSSEIGRGVIIAAKAGISGHLHIGDGAQVAGTSGVHKNVPAGAIVVGTPAESQREFMARLMLPGRVEKLKAQIEELKNKLSELEK